MEEGRRAFKIVTCTPTGKTPLGRPRRRWEDNIRMDLKELGINTKKWVNQAQDRDYCPCECGIESHCSTSYVVSYLTYRTTSLFYCVDVNAVNH